MTIEDYTVVSKYISEILDETDEKTLKDSDQNHEEKKE